jgi:hypothetical protein
MTFNIISAGDPVLAAPIMQNFRHVNYGGALLPVNSSGAGINNTLDIGSSSYKWKDAFLSGGLNVGSATGAGTGSIVMRNDQAAFTGVLIDNRSTSAGSYSGISIGSNSIGTPQWYITRENQSTGRLDVALTYGAPMVTITANGNVGIGTTAPDKKLEINSSTGACLRLTYNDSNGSATTYSDFTVLSSGILYIQPTGGAMQISGDFTASGNIVSGQTQAGGRTIYSQSFVADGGLSSFGTILCAGYQRECGFTLYKNSGLNGCATIFLDAENNTNYFLWVDNSGKLRISTASTDIGTTGGTVVGTQS